MKATTTTTKSSKSTAGTTPAPRRDDKPAPVTDPAIAANAQRPPEARPSVIVPLDAIIVREGWNIRKHFDETEAAQLEESVRKHGVMEPILLATGAEPGKFHLVAGERRYRAASKVGLPGIPAVIITSDETSAAEDENFKRSEITHADRCRYVKVKRDAGMPFAAIGAIIGKSEQTAITDYGIATKLLPEIFDAWSRFPAASKIALEIYAKPAEEQRAAWGKWLANRGAGGGKSKRGKAKGNGATTGPDDDGGPQRKTKGELSAVYADLVKLRSALTPGDSDMGWLDGAVWALEFMAGQAPMPPHYLKRIEAVKNPKQAKLFG